MSEFPVIYGRSPVFAQGARDDYFLYVKEFQKLHPHLSWHQAVKKASKSYHKVEHKPKRKVAKRKPKKKVSKKKKGGVAAGIVAGSLVGGDYVGEFVQPGLLDRHSAEVVHPYIKSMPRFDAKDALLMANMALPRDVMMDHHIMASALSAGILEGGAESHAERRLAALEGWLHHYEKEAKQFRKKAKLEHSKL